MSDLIAKKKARLEQLKKEAADKRNRGNRNAPKASTGTGGQGGKADDINELMDKVINSSSFEERKKEETKEPVQKPVNTSMTVAVDQ